MNTQHQNKTCVCIQKLVICSQTGHKHMPIKLNVNKHAYIEHECFPYEFEVMHNVFLRTAKQRSFKYKVLFIFK